MRLFCHIAILVTLAACSDDPKSESDTSTTSTTATDTSDDTAVDPNACATGLPSGMSGTWAVLEKQTAIVQDVPVFGTQTQVATSLYLATLSGTSAATIDFTLCDWVTTDVPDGFITTTMGATVLENLDPLVRTMHVSDREDGTVGFEAENGYQLRGVALTDVANEAMPTDDTDPRVIDQDEDGDPGISLVVSGTSSGEIYSIQRHQAALDGCFTSATRIVGLTDWTTEQVILGSNPDLLSAGKPKSSTHPDASLSNFVMVKVGDADDCAAIKAARATLFPDE